MRLMRPVARLAVLIGLLALSRSAWAGASAEAIANWAGVVNDLAQPDADRMKARDHLIQQGAPGLDALVELGKKPGLAKEEDNDNVRMQVAIALANVRIGPAADRNADVVRKKAAENLDLLKSWLERKDADPALRYWAIRAISFAQAQGSLNILKNALDAKPDPSVRMSIARSLGLWEPPALTTVAIPMLTAMLKDQDPAARVAAVEGLRLTKRNEEDVVVPLFGILESDPDEAAWRAAAKAIESLTKMDFNKFLVERHTPKERKEFFDQRELDWKRPRAPVAP